MSTEFEEQGQPETETEQQPQQPEVDPRLALEIAAKHFNVTPEYIEGSIRLQDENRRQIDSIRKRERELELKERELEALTRERQRYADPNQYYPDVDPAVRPVVDRLDRIEKRFQEDDRRREERERQEAYIAERSRELEDAYGSFMRTVPTQNQIEADKFFDAMINLYGPGGVPEGVSADKAVFYTAKVLGLPSGNGNGYQRQAARDPRAQFVVPVGGSAPPQPATQALGAQRPEMKPGQTPEQYAKELQEYSQKLSRQLQESGWRSGGFGMSDKMRVSSE